mmetsp:Transcript_63454/g.112832  ORF Transcript_63454/g.112832 Transcript_63454/m.112832 type:complete len:82 (-) Transcript_63454:470-715(-)
MRLLHLRDPAHGQPRVRARGVDQKMETEAPDFAVQAPAAQGVSTAMTEVIRPLLKGLLAAHLTLPVVAHQLQEHQVMVCPP